MLRFVLMVIAVAKQCGAEDALKADLDRMNDEMSKMNAIASQLGWKLSVEPSEELEQKKLRLGEIHAEWRNLWCERLSNDVEDAFGGNRLGTSNWILGGEREELLRECFLLCRGPKFSAEEARQISENLYKLQSIYQTSRVSFGNGTSLNGEPDLERLMATSRDQELLLWSWTEWRNAVGLPSRAMYTEMVRLMNAAAKNNGYNDIGECWREELESDDLEELVDELYREIKPLYLALHAVTRYKLSRYYGSVVSLDDPIPAHLLGNMWAQNWGSLIDLFVPNGMNVTENLRRRNFTVVDLVKRAEDFYVSLGFKPMTEEFWKYSKLEKSDKNGSNCHASAANMFRKNDFRIQLCAEVSAEDFYIIHHEMGHVQYYMEYQNQPAIFQDGANSAFQEAIGDAIVYGVVTPIHLQRLGLLREVDESSGMDLRLLLEQALTKIPQIPFALALEKWRWGVFRGDISSESYNEEWWRLVEKYQGLKPPLPRGEEFFDAASKFHIIDNTPYIRYFISSILQMQIFEALCKGTIFGTQTLNRTLPLPLHKCDIYGSKDGAKNLRRMMSLGRSIHWTDALYMITGERNYSVGPLLNYYKPLYEWLLREIKIHDIPVDW